MKSLISQNTNRWCCILTRCEEAIEVDVRNKNKLLRAARHVRSHVQCSAEILTVSYANVASCIWLAYAKSGTWQIRRCAATRRIFFLVLLLLVLNHNCGCTLDSLWVFLYMSRRAFVPGNRQSKWRSIAKVFSCRRLLYGCARAVLLTCLLFFSVYLTILYRFGNSGMCVFSSFERVK